MAIYEQIMQRFQDDIRSGKLVQGDRLPTQPEIAEEYDVAVFTVQRAVNVMKRDGLVYTTHAGTYIGPRPKRESPEETPEVVRCNTGTCHNILELRIAGTRQMASVASLLPRTGWIYRDSQLGRVYFCHVCAPGVVERETGN